MAGVPPQQAGPGDAEVRFDASKEAQECVVCRAAVTPEGSAPLAALTETERALVGLTATRIVRGGRMCASCLARLRGGGGGINRALNTFARFESYHEFISAAVRAYVGALVAGTLFQTLNLGVCVLGALGFALFPWGALVAGAWYVFSYPPFLIPIVFLPFAVIVFFGSRPFAFAAFIDDPASYLPWTTFVPFDETYLYAMALAGLIIVTLYLLGVFSVEYLEGSNPGAPGVNKENGVPPPR